MKNNKGFISTVAMFSTLLIVLLLIYYIMYFLSMGKVTSNYILEQVENHLPEPGPIVENSKTIIQFASNDSYNESDINFGYTTYFGELDEKQTSEQIKIGLRNDATGFGTSCKRTNVNTGEQSKYLKDFLHFYNTRYLVNESLVNSGNIDYRSETVYTCPISTSKIIDGLIYTCNDGTKGGYEVDIKYCDTSNEITNDCSCRISKQANISGKIYYDIEQKDTIDFSFNEIDAIKKDNLDNYNKYYISYIDVDSYNLYDFKVSDFPGDYKKIIYINQDDSENKQKIATTLGISENYVIYKNNINEAILDAKTKISNDLVELKNKRETDNNSEQSFVNKPVLINNNGLIPVEYNETTKKWYIADISNDWYNYDEFKWANAVTVIDDYSDYRDYVQHSNEEIPTNAINTMWIWIPRYKYRINKSTDTIDIEFTSINEAAHPAFTFGNTELSGFWFAKYTSRGSTGSENGVKNITRITINGNGNKFGFTSGDAQAISVAEAFRATRRMEVASGNGTTIFSLNQYGFTSETYLDKYGENNDDYYKERAYGTYGNGDYETTNNKINTHMSKGTEWSAVAYLAQSKYGNYSNSSTTGNKYGVYEMDSDEYVMTTMYSKDMNYKSDFYLKYNFDKSICLGKADNSCTTKISDIYKQWCPIGNSFNGFIGCGNLGNYTNNMETRKLYGIYNSGIPYPDPKYYDIYDYGKENVILGESLNEYESDTNNKHINKDVPFLVKKMVNGEVNTEYDFGLLSKYQSFRITLVNTD